MRYRKLKKLEMRLKKEIIGDARATQFIRIDLEIALAKCQETIDMSGPVISVATTLTTFIVAPVLAFIGVLAGLTEASSGISSDQKLATVQKFAHMGVQFVSTYFLAVYAAIVVLLIASVIVPRLWRIHLMHRMKVYEMVLEEFRENDDPHYADPKP